MASDAPSRKAAIAASFAATTTVRLTGSGPRTIASRRSKLSCSHTSAAISPIDTIEYVMNIVASRRVIGSTSWGARFMANANTFSVCTDIIHPGVSRNARTAICACRRCMSDVTDSDAKN